MSGWDPETLFVSFLQKDSSLGVRLLLLGVREGLGNQINLMRIISVCQASITRQGIVTYTDHGVVSQRVLLYSF